MTSFNPKKDPSRRRISAVLSAKGLAGAIARAKM